MSKTLTVGQVAQALRCHECTARGYLHEVNAEIDRATINRAEAVDRATLIALGRRHAGNKLGRRLEQLLLRLQ